MIKKFEDFVKHLYCCNHVGFLAKEDFTTDDRLTFAGQKISVLLGHTYLCRYINEVSVTFNKAYRKIVKEKAVTSEHTHFVTINHIFLPPHINS